MNIKSEFKHRVDEKRYLDAIDAANFLADNFIKNGRYYVDESWGPEGILYLAESSWALMDCYRIFGIKKHLDGVIAILNEIKSLQKLNGGWSIDLGESGTRFSITEEQRADSSKYVDPPTTAAFLRTIAEYQVLTGDESYYSIGDKAFRYLIELWDPVERTFVDKTQRKLLGLRSNPSSYHLFFLLGVHAWKQFQPEKLSGIYHTLLSFVKDNYESFDEHTMPLITALHASVLIDHCDMEYIKNVIKPRIDQNLVNNKVFSVPSVPGGYGHRDGLRGIVTTEVHLRSCAGIAISMKQYDLATGTNIYRNSERYKEIESWIDKMKGEGFFYEFEDCTDGKRIGYGSPGQYLPCWWILGKV